MYADDNPCPCTRGNPYRHCCKPLHEGELASNALQLMRSRYAAYVLNLPDYIIRTTHPANPQYTENFFSWKRSISRFSKESLFKGLEVHDFKAHQSLATVTFTVHLTQEGEDGTFTERSFFELIKGRWLYRGGQITDGRAPNLATTGPLRILPLAYYGDPILRRKADPVKEITDAIKKLAEEMIETMDASNGLGLAAPQVHHSIRLFVIRTPHPSEEEGYILGDVKVFINPKISSTSKETWKASEGCLSIPTLHAQVERPKEITLEYTDLEGNHHCNTFSGWEAKVILHEYDHIEGILFTDRLSEEEQSNLEPILKNLHRRIHDGTEM